MGIKAIETAYDGYRFRSRLEARYAVFLNVLNILWDYEKEGYDLGPLGYYLPDFWLPQWNIFAEVKPTRFTQEEFYKAAALPHGCLLLDGTPDIRHFYLAGAYPLEEVASDWEAYKLTGIDGYGTVNLEWTLAKGRLWYDYGEGVESYNFDTLPDAVIAARSARFEHGECG